MSHVFQTTPPVFLLVCSKKKVSQFSALQPNDFDTLLHNHKNTGKGFFRLFREIRDKYRKELNEIMIYQLILYFTIILIAENRRLHPYWLIRIPIFETSSRISSQNTELSFC